MNITRQMITTAECNTLAGLVDVDGISRFIQSRIDQSGGFLGRGSRAELYQTQFAIMSCLAIDRMEPLADIERYLGVFRNSVSLDLVDLCSLARCLSLVPGVVNQQWKHEILKGVESFATNDGGYSATAGQAVFTIYGCFMALGALQDLDGDQQRAEKIALAIEAYRMAVGGYANDPAVPVATTPVTAAAAVLLKYGGQEVKERTLVWLLSRLCPEGGFAAAAFSPAADLLSTAVTILAFVIVGGQLDQESIDNCRDYCLSLVRENGGFAGSVDDPGADVEYTFYGLLALGGLNILNERS